MSKERKPKLVCSEFIEMIGDDFDTENPLTLQHIVTWAESHKDFSSLSEVVVEDVTESTGDLECYSCNRPWFKLNVYRMETEDEAMERETNFLNQKICDLEIEKRELDQAIDLLRKHGQAVPSSARKRLGDIPVQVMNLKSEMKKERTNE